MRKRYRKLPVVIDAVRNTGEWKPLYEWLVEVTAGLIPGIRHQDGSLRLGGRPVITRNEDASLNIETLEGTMRADVGDWVILGVRGEFYPCKPDIFKATYEEVVE